jgi:hypothetical protein
MQTKRKLRLNPNKLVVVPHNMGSRAAKELASTLSTKLGYKVWRVTPDKVKGRKAFVLNAGTNKITQMEAFDNAQVSHPEYTRDTAIARSWIADGSSVMCRTLLRASEGRGIVVADTVDQLVPAPLYTKYVKKKAEYRVHVLNGQVIDVQHKRKKREFDGQRDTKVRNLANGYVFTRAGLVEPAGLRELAVASTSSLGYTLGAVDIAFNERSNLLVVLEVNACPGMQGTTLESYANAIVAGLRESGNGRQLI